MMRGHIFVLAIACCFRLDAVPLFAVEIIGRISAITENELVVITESQVDPVVGQSLDVFVDVPGIGPVSFAVVKLTAVKDGLVMATIDELTGQLAVDQRVRMGKAASVSDARSESTALNAALPAEPKSRVTALGLDVRNIEASMAEVFDLPSTQGCLVNAVTAGSSADQAGLKKRDMVRTVDGLTVLDAAGFEQAIAATASRTVKFEIWRDGAMKSIELALPFAAAPPLPPSIMPATGSTSNKPEVRFPELLYGPVLYPKDTENEAIKILGQTLVREHLSAHPLDDEIAHRRSLGRFSGGERRIRRYRGNGAR